MAPEPLLPPAAVSVMLLPSQILVRPPVPSPLIVVGATGLVCTVIVLEAHPVAIVQPLAVPTRLTR